MDLKDIPKAYGGELEWEFFDEPNLNVPELQRIFTWENGHTKLPAGPLIWRRYGDGSRLELVAMGCKDGKQREERVATIPIAHPQDEKKAEINGTAITNPLPVNGDAPKTADVNVDATADQLQKTTLNAGEAAPVSEKTETVTEAAATQETVKAQ